MESWGKIYLGGQGVALPEFRRVPRTCRPHMGIRPRNIERFYAIIPLSAFLRPYFPPSRLLSPPSSIRCSLTEGQEGVEGDKANLLTLNRRGGVAARIKLQGGEKFLLRRSVAVDIGETTTLLAD